MYCDLRIKTDFACPDPCSLIGDLRVERALTNCVIGNLPGYDEGLDG